MAAAALVAAAARRTALGGSRFSQVATISLFHPSRRSVPAGLPYGYHHDAGTFLATMPRETVGAADTASLLAVRGALAPRLRPRARVRGRAGSQNGAARDRAGRRGWAGAPGGTPPTRKQRPVACARRAAAPRRWPDELPPARRWAKGQVRRSKSFFLTSGRGPMGRVARTEAIAMLMTSRFFFIYPRSVHGYPPRCGGRGVLLDSLE